MRVSEDFEFYFAGPASILETGELNESELLKLFTDYGFTLDIEEGAVRADVSFEYTPPISLRLNLYFSLIVISEGNVKAAIRRELERGSLEPFRNQLKHAAFLLKDYFNRTTELRSSIAEEIELGNSNEDVKKANMDSRVIIEYLMETLHGLLRWLWENYFEIIEVNDTIWTEIIYGNQKDIWLNTFKAYSIALFGRNSVKSLISSNKSYTSIIERAKCDLLSFYGRPKDLHNDYFLMSIVLKLENGFFLTAFPEYLNVFENRPLDSKHYCKEGFQKIKESLRKELEGFKGDKEAKEFLTKIKERAGKLYWIFENSPIEGSLIKMFQAYLEEITHWPNSEDNIISFGDEMISVFNSLKRYVAETDHTNLMMLLEGKRPSSRIYWTKSANQFLGLLEDLGEAGLIKFRGYEKAFAKWLPSYFDYTPKKGSNAGKRVSFPASDPSYKDCNKRPQKGSPNRLSIK